MQVKTITTAAGVNEIDFSNDSSQSTAHFYWLKNLGDSTLYVSANPNPIAEKDDVAELSAKGAVSVETDEGKIYVLGAGKVEIHRTNSKFCPFDWQSSGSGGGGGGSITVDSELSETSVNPLQNKATTAAINEVKSDLVKTREDVAENAAALNTKSDIDHIHDITANGNPVIMDNLQGGVPFSEMVVSGKNLIPYPYYDGDSKTHNGITFTVNADGTITANGTATASAIFYISTNYKIKKGIYTLSGCPKSSSNTDYILQFATGDWSFKISDFGNGATTQIDNDINLQIFRIVISSGVVCDNLVFRPQLELGDAATAYEPPITGRELTVNMSGKTLLKYPYVNTTKTINGITFTDNGDGTVTANGTATAMISFALIWKNLHIPKGTYAISGCPKEGNVNTGFFIVCGTDTIRFATDTGNGGTFTISDDTNDFTFSIRISNGVTVDNLVFRTKLELGDTATPYEPYNGSTTTITPESNPYTVPNDIRQQEGYNVISVSEGELSVVSVQKNAAIKRIWDDMRMDLLFDGVTSADNPAVVDLANYKFVEIHHILIADDKTYPANIRLSLDNYLTSASTIITPLHASSINTVHTEDGMVSSLYATSAAGNNMNNTKIYGIK